MLFGRYEMDTKYFSFVEYYELYGPRDEGLARMLSLQGI